ncbi:McrC family protein [Acrocarpospora catenulata]|uniref:McrC family protein n=1 Tax=Acrocarpospora catenulata TaxID=2836182 RepID=UPI001BDA25B0|nr:McrC family protein [Acrocarpospora catenulata]
MTPVVVDEYQTVKVSGLNPSGSDRELSESEELNKRIKLRWLPDGALEVTATSHVGVVALDCVTIHVRPKLAGRELSVLRMLDYASGLSALRYVDRLRHLPDVGHNLRDLICLLLAIECEALLRGGLRRDYVHREELLPAVRGRLLADRQMLRRFGRLDRLECRFDEFEADILDNQVCAAALQVAAQR